MYHGQIEYNLTNHIAKICCLYNFTKVILAISGGQDSILLIKLFLYIQVRHKIINQIEFIYIDHQWKRDSQQQVKHLINYLNAYNQSLSVYQINHTNNVSEHYARQERYNILINHAIHDKYECIITAHTKTDLIETFLINLIRGTSIDGATNFKQHKLVNHNIHILRPFLGLDRYCIKFLCNKLCLPVWSDSSNTNLHLTRNRIRNELTPYLHNYFNQNINNNITKFLNICEINNEYIKQNVLKLYLISHHNKYIAINHQIINKQHLVLKNKLIQLFFLLHFNIILKYNEIQIILNSLKSSTHIILNTLNIKSTSIWLYII